MTEFDVIDETTEELVAELESLEEDWEDEPIFVVGTNVEYAVYLEMGTSKMPAYPWFRPAVRELRADPEGFIDDNTKTTAEEIDSSEDLVQALAFGLERQLKQNVAADRSADRSPGVDPDHPQVQTGNLRASIRAQRIQ